MKFDYCIGNPPYQLNRETTKDMPIYNAFMDAAYGVADKVELITPARFLFNAGATPKEWNNKMLDDEHFKVLKYEMDSQKVFSGVDIKGGVAIHYHDNTNNFGKIGTFSSVPEIDSIKSKLNPTSSLSSIMYPYSTYTISDKFWDDFPNKKEEVEHISKNRKALSKEEKAGKLSNLRILTTNIFDLIPEVFFDTKPDDSEEYAYLLGRQSNKRCGKYISKRYIDVGDNFNCYKVIIPAVNGSGAIGEVLSTPVIGTPGTGYTQSFLGVGAFNTESEAINCEKYIKTKFARTCLGILKITQHNPPEKWKYVPLQDFSSSSDIDWSKSIPEIDQQLYKKYNLTKEEIDFIESHVKEMN